MALNLAFGNNFRSFQIRVLDPKEILETPLLILNILEIETKTLDFQM